MSPEKHHQSPRLAKLRCSFSRSRVLMPLTVVGRSFGSSTILRYIYTVVFRSFWWRLSVVGEDSIYQQAHKKAVRPSIACIQQLFQLHPTMMVITAKSLAKLMEDNSDFKKNWKRSFIGDFEQAHIHSVISGTTKEGEQRVS